MRVPRAGMRENDLFNPLDLLHQSDMVSVVSCLDRCAGSRRADTRDTRRLGGPPRSPPRRGGGKLPRPPFTPGRRRRRPASYQPQRRRDTVGPRVFGIEAEDCARRTAKWEALQAPGAEDEAVAFVEGRHIERGARCRRDASSWLGDGVVLCAAADALRPLDQEDQSV